MKTKRTVLNHGFVELINYYPKDNPELAIVNAARISFKQKSESLGERELGILRFLMRERHGTPWEAVDFQFYVKAPIFVAREWMRHRIASYNELSQRYRLAPDDYYLPHTMAIRKQVGKPGAYRFENITDPNIQYHVIQKIDEISDQCIQAYKELLNLGVAKELARCVLPLNLYTEFLFKVNFRSLLNFLSLRNHPQALHEIRVYAKSIEDIVTHIMPNAMKFFNEFDRTAP